MWYLFSIILACVDVRKVQKHQAHDIEKIQTAFVEVVVPSADFQMGSLLTIDSKPIVAVQLSHAFIAMKSEVTQELYQLVMHDNPSFFKKCGLQCPVEKVRWIETIQFANVLSKIQGFEECYEMSDHDIHQGKVRWVQGYECRGWRLPTEAEWEWMAVEGSSGMGSSKEKDVLLNDLAWFHSNSNHTTHPVCEKKENALGLCDVLGNVQEWVWDIPDSYPSKKAVIVDPQGGLLGSHHGFRGGAWNRYAQNINTYLRKDGSYLFHNNDLGFRLVRTQ